MINHTLFIYKHARVAEMYRVLVLCLKEHLYLCQQDIICNKYNVTIFNYKKQTIIQLLQLFFMLYIRAPNFSAH